MTAKANKLGQLGEQAAAKFLKSRGYKIVEMNYKNDFGRRLGEIDIIARDSEEKELVFVEVKTREYCAFKDTLPEENITYEKLKKLSKIAWAYMRSKKIEDEPYRFDALSVWMDKESKVAKIKHIKSL